MVKILLFFRHVALFSKSEILRLNPQNFLVKNANFLSAMGLK